MKVFVAHFTAECNEHIRHIVDKEDFTFLYGQECIDAMGIEAVFNEQSIQLVPSIYAEMSPNGMIGLETYEFIKEKIVTSLKHCINDIDGLYLQFHGASGVCGLDCVSGEHDLLASIRKITGSHMPIAMVMDPHGNLTNELASHCNIIRCYRESPHSDMRATEIKVAQLLINLLNNRRVMHPIVKKLPIMVGGEKSVSAKEPVKSINQLMDKFESDSRVFSISFHVGYIRHDDDKLGAAVTVIPNTVDDIEYCESIANKVSEFIWKNRNKFQFSGNYGEVDDVVERALNYPDKTVVITDSGDNCGAGGYGENTIVLRELLKHNTNKKILVAGINDINAYATLNHYKQGEKGSLTIGLNDNLENASVEVDFKLKQIGTLRRGYDIEKCLGNSYLINIENTNIDVVVMNDNIQFGFMEQFESVKAPFHDYDIVIVKMGYLDTYLIPETKYHLMALSDGPTIQRSERIPFKKIARPMWPIDEFDKLYYID